LLASKAPTDDLQWPEMQLQNHFPTHLLILQYDIICKYFCSQRGKLKALLCFHKWWGQGGKKKKNTKKTGIINKETPDKTISKKSNRDAVRCVVKTSLRLCRRQLQPDQLYTRQLTKAATCTAIPQTFVRCGFSLSVLPKVPTALRKLTAVTFDFTFLVKADYVLQVPDVFQWAITQIITKN